MKIQENLLEKESKPSEIFSRNDENHDQSMDIVVKNLNKEFIQDKKKVKVLSDINVEVPRGQAVALIGHNGSGKSTLLRCCLRLIEPTSGAIRLLGQNIQKLSGKNLRNVRSKIGFIFQGHNLVPRLSALSNVLHGAQAYKKGPQVWYHWLAKQEDRLRAMECLDKVGLAHLALRRADRLSGGESQRVAIARALMQKTRMIFADEPVASLDPNAGREIMECFINLMKEEGITFLFVSHNLEHALEYSDRVIGLRKGCLDLDAKSVTLSASGLKGLYD